MMEEEKASESDVMQQKNLATSIKDEDLDSRISYDILPPITDNKARNNSISTTSVSKE